MFSVKPIGQNLEVNRTILSGVAFGFINHPNQPVVFEVKSEKIQSPYFVEFNVSTESSKKSFEFERSNPAPNRLCLMFYNPSPTGSSGLKTPTGILVLEDKYILGFMFSVDLVGEGPCYRLTYEFYDGLIAKPAKSE